MLDEDIRELQIRAKQFESDARKGRTPSEDDCQSVCMSYKNVVNGLVATYPEEDFEKEIDSRCYTLSPLLVPFYIKEIVADLAELTKRAFLLMLENMQTPRKPKEKEAKPPVKAHEQKVFDAQQKTKQKRRAKLVEKEFEADGPDKMSVQKRNNMKISGHYNGNAGNIKVAQSREQKQAAERAERARNQAAQEKIAHEQTTSEPEQAMSFGE